MNVNNRIKLISKERGINIKDLAKKVGMSLSGLYTALEKDTLKVSTLIKIAKELEVSVDSFFDVDIKYLFELHIPGYLFDNKINFISKRYSKFTEKIIFYKDYYLYSVVVAIREGFRPEYKCIHKDFSGKVLSEDHISLFDDFDIDIELTPYSHLPIKYREIIDNTLIFNGFYFPIFDINFLNINGYLEDGMVTDNELISYWSEWQKE